MNTHDTLKTPWVGLTAAYREPTFLCRLTGMAHGLRQPRGSREYRAAVVELERLSAPVTALLLPLLMIVLLGALSDENAVRDPLVGVIVLEIDSPPKEWLKPDEPVTPDKTVDDDFTIDIPLVSPAVKAEPVAEAAVMNLVPAAIGPVIIKNIPSFTGIIGSGRTAEARKTQGVRYGNDGMTEEAVLRSLRWLKKNQQPDGSWKNQRVAMTGLAVLTFLAHGEKPGDSPEFGAAVQSALEFLVRSQRPDGRFSGMDGSEYAHPIATYALCEAYGMTLNPNVKAAAEKALVPIISGQHPTGGWTYKMNPLVDKESGKYRDDTSYMGWCAQALKAAKLAKLHAEGLEKATKLAVRGFKNNGNPSGGFGYVSPGTGGLTGVGTLCMQLLGASSEPEVKKSLDLMESWLPSFDEKGPMGGSLQYYFYYATQAKFHAGGKRWENWNSAMKPAYVKAQQVEKNAVKDDKGRDCDIGWWTNGDTHTDRPVMDTCLAALQLMVYYRYLPTTSKAATQSNELLAAVATDGGDITVDAGNL